MQKRERFRLTDLEKVITEKEPKSYSEEELLNIIRNPQELAQKDEVEQLLMVGAIAEKMNSSQDFKRRVMEEIRKARPKGTP